MNDVFAAIGVLLWAYLILARGWFWLGLVRDGNSNPAPRQWPRVTAVIPARNEADVIAASVQSLLRQDYSGPFNIVVVDDDSDDGTAAAARAAGAVTVVTSHGPPDGWAGKPWALKQGVTAAEPWRPDYLFFTDADIVHAQDTLTWLVAQSCAGSYLLTSLMAKLRCRSLAERAHVPAFVYFFQMVYPFAWVSDPRSGTAAAAGGCMLIRADALGKAGGVAAIRDALIDDCSLARRLKAVGPIWLGLTERVHSIRRYESFGDAKRMISRSAFAQLRYSPLLLAAAIAGMALTFLIPPWLAIAASGPARLAGWATWLVMAASFQPILRFYRLSPLWGIALPGVALLYVFYTIDSAYRHWTHRGGQWKGRIHVDALGRR